MKSSENKQKQWIKISIQSSADTKEAIASYLFDLGSNGLEEDENLLIAYFPSSRNAEDLKHTIKSYIQNLSTQGAQVLPPRIICQLIPDQDWNSEWKKHYKPVLVKNQLLIKPGWLPAPHPPHPHTIEIDPQMAFGTGTHATTRLLLEFIVDAIQGGETMLDIGTGTGILAIAAAKLGAQKVLAFDIDPIATSTAQANIRKNNVQDKILLFTGTLDLLKKHAFDVIFANINRIETLKILPFIAEMLDYKGGFFISGILIEEQDILTKEIKKSGLRIQQITTIEEWIAFRTEKL